MQVTINQISGGLLAQVPKTQLVSFTFEDLPRSVRERAKVLLSPDTVGEHTAEAVIPGSADRMQFEIEYVDMDQMRRICVDEAACSPEFLELVDELSSAGL